MMKATITRDYTSTKISSCFLLFETGFLRLFGLLTKPLLVLLNFRSTWMDFLDPVVSSSNIPTIPLVVAQAMNPAPRPPSPGAREATQRAHRRDNPNQLSSRDAQILLMGLPAAGKDTKSPTGSTSNGNGQLERTRLESFFTNDTTSITAQDQSPKKLAGVNASSKVSAPPRPSRETRRFSTNADSVGFPYPASQMHKI